MRMLSDFLQVTFSFIYLMFIFVLVRVRGCVVWCGVLRCCFGVVWFGLVWFGLFRVRR
jgi:hypothetical protein